MAIKVLLETGRIFILVRGDEGVQVRVKVIQHRAEGDVQHLAGVELIQQPLPTLVPNGRNSQGRNGVPRRYSRSVLEARPP